MLLDSRLEYVIVSDDWFKSTGKFHCLASRHGNAVIELYSGTSPQLWRVSRSGRIRNCGDEATTVSGYAVRTHLDSSNAKSPDLKSHQRIGFSSRQNGSDSIYENFKCSA